MKLAITGKGGVGKTTVSALLARALAARGRSVVAIDADPDSNLAACLGHPQPENIRPLVEMKDLIEERTGVRPGTTGGMFRLNPFVADIPERYGADVDGIKVLVTGAVKKGGSGCYCPENAFLRALITHLFTDGNTALVLDMEAGIEHLSRGTLGGVERLLIVTEAGRRSMETALRIASLARDIGLTRLGVVGNKIRAGGEEQYLRENLPDMEFAGFLPFDERIREAEAAGRPAWRAGADMERAVAKIVDRLKGTLERHDNDE